MVIEAKVAMNDLRRARDHSRWSEGGASALTPEQNTRHLFVETNWLHEYAAPAHHKVPAAVTLLEKAQRGDFFLQIPNVSIAEARLSIQTKCQPTDGPGMHRYIRWAHKSGELNDGQAEDAHRLADSYVQEIRKE
jgi:hypothetical protein